MRRRSREKKPKVNTPILEPLMIDGNMTLDQTPKVYTPKLFDVIRQDKTLLQFCQDFQTWNKHVPWLVYKNSQPHKDLLQKLAEAAAPHLGESLVDIGCGYGEFFLHVLQNYSPTVRKYFAIDLDWEPLVQIPHSLNRTSFRERIYLIRTAVMMPLPIRTRSVDSVVSSLGGLMYSWMWFDEQGKLIAQERSALQECLKDIHRILKPSGILAFSAPLPNPNWNIIRKASVKQLFKERAWKRMWEAWYYGKRAVQYSRFLNELEHAGRAHYLSLEEWRMYLSEANFEVFFTETGSFAGQGLIIVARKL